MLCRNRQILRLPQTATRCAVVQIRASSTNTAKATRPRKARDDADKPNGDDKSPRKFRPRKPLYDSEGNLVPEGWTIDKETREVRPIRKKASKQTPGTDEAPPLVSTLLQGSDTATSDFTSPPFVKDRETREWRLRRSNKGTTVKSLKNAAPELLEALEQAKATKEEEREARRKRKALEEEEKLARRQIRQAAREERERELELRRQAKLEAQQRRAEEDQALKDAREARRLAAAEKAAANPENGKIRLSRQRRKASEDDRTLEQKLAEKAEKARIRNRLHKREIRAKEKQKREAESAMAQLERISRATSAESEDLSGAQSNKARTKREISKRTGETLRKSKPKKKPSTVVPQAMPKHFEVVSDQSRGLSERLEAVAPWKADPARKRPKAPKDLKDYNRVNIISENLCDDIINYMGKDLDRHIGCDLLDMNPGVGVWSKKLNDRLQPRKHIMLEADADVYQPFMDDLLQKPNVHLINSTPYLWTELEKQMAEHLTEQTIQPQGSPKERNDTLLVTANIGWWPTQLLYRRNSMALMIVYQMIQAIHSSTLFQKYGNVRMLLWVDDHTRSRLLPRQVHGRRRFAFVADVATEWIHEIAGGEVEEKETDRKQMRDVWIDFESNAMSYLHMKAGQREMPAHRRPSFLEDVLSSPGLIGERLAGERVPMFRRTWYNDLEKLNEATPEALAGNDKAKHQKYYLKKRSALLDREAQGHLEGIQMYERAIAAHGSPEAQTYIDEFHKVANSWSKSQKSSFETVLDDYRLFRNPTGPLLAWDRRHLDPLRTHPKEYFPNVPLTLMDIQPKTMAPLLQQYGRHSTRSGDMSDLLLRLWFSGGKRHPAEAMASIWHGFGEKDIVDQCPSFTDPRAGGVPLELGSCAGQRVRNTTEQQWLEVLQAWMEWPFKPTYVEMVGQSVEESSAMGFGDDD